MGTPNQKELNGYSVRDEARPLLSPPWNPSHGLLRAESPFWNGRIGTCLGHSERHGLGASRRAQTRAEGREVRAGGNANTTQFSGCKLQCQRPAHSGCSAHPGCLRLKGLAKRRPCVTPRALSSALPRRNNLSPKGCCATRASRKSPMSKSLEPT